MYEMRPNWTKLLLEFEWDKMLNTF